MGITIHSPFDASPIKVRDQDIGRAVRDKQGRIFYVLKKPDGTGYYAAPTRVGTEKDIQRYDKMIGNMTRGREIGAAASQQQIHDATGKRSSTLPKIALITLAAAAAAVAYLYATNQLPI